MRASVTHEADDSFVRENILLDIALRGEREDASVACSGLGLCLAGVGYDLTDLALNKVKVKSVRQPVNDIQTQALREKKSRAVPNGQFETSDDVVSEDISDADGNSDGV